jgi:hypothetical protein
MTAGVEREEDTEGETTEENQENSEADVFVHVGTAGRNSDKGSASLPTIVALVETDVPDTARFAHRFQARRRSLTSTRPARVAKGFFSFERPMREPVGESKTQTPVSNTDQSTSKREVGV